MYVPRVSYDPVEKIWSGELFESIYNPDQNVGHLILKILQQTPEKVTQVSHETNVEVTCGEMYKRTIKMANFIANLGLVQGDVVGFMACNSENLAPVIFACLSLSLPINPLHESMHKNELAQLWGKSKPKMIFCDGNLINLVKSTTTELKLNAKICTFMEKVEGYQFVDEIINENFNVEGFV
jgi:4-coumarate--CoA ligase